MHMYILCMYLFERMYMNTFLRTWRYLKETQSGKARTLTDSSFTDCLPT